MTNPNNLGFDRKPWLDFFVMVPIALCVFPIPFAFPFGLIMLFIEQPEELPLLLIFFSWLVASLFLIYLNEKA